MPIGNFVINVITICTKKPQARPFTASASLGAYTRAQYQAVTHNHCFVTLVVLLCTEGLDTDSLSLIYLCIRGPWQMYTLRPYVLDTAQMMGKYKWGRTPWQDKGMPLFSHTSACPRTDTSGTRRLLLCLRSPENPVLHPYKLSRDFTWCQRHLNRYRVTTMSIRYPNSSKEQKQKLIEFSGWENAR